MSFGQVLAVRSFPLEQVRHGVEPQSIDSHSEPKIEDFQHRVSNVTVVEVEIRLVTIETMPKISAGDRIPAPIGRLEVLENDARFAVFIRCIAPHIPIAPTRTWRGMT